MATLSESEVGNFMHFELLVEEQSAEAALNNVLPRILGDNHQFYIHPYNGKADLLVKLPSRLNGYRHWITDDMRIIVLIDLDTRDCEVLKSELEAFSSRSRLFIKKQTEFKRYVSCNKQNSY